MINRELTVALVGNPNCGKTSLFNALTGLNYKVSNFPGTTIEKKTGTAKLDDATRANIIDLPGTYSLYPKSIDELVTYELLRSNSNEHALDLVLFIADASNLKRNLLLLTQVADLGIPVVLALNMVDIAERKGIFYDTRILSEALNIPVVSINARKRSGVKEIKGLLLDRSTQKTNIYYKLDFLSQEFKDEVKTITHKSNEYAALQYAITSSQLKGEKADKTNTVFDKHKFNTRSFQEHEILERYHFIDKVVRESRKQKQGILKGSLTQKLDRILTHRVWGIVIFLSILFLVFQAIFSWSAIPMEWVELGFGVTSEWAQNTLPAGVLNDLLVQGVLAGLSGVLVFLPQIIILFTFIAILEDVGYMARVGFIMDRMMRPFGMNGKSIVPLISGMACAVPSIMATRSIENKKERLITILVTPLMSCSARLPVYTLLIAMLVSDDVKWGPFNVHGMVLMAMYLLGFVAALFSAFVFKFFIKTERKNFFLMELPGYKLPVLRNLFITIYDKGAAFVWGAGKIIVAVSIVLWALASFGPKGRMQAIEQKYNQISMTDSLISEEDLLTQKNAEKLKASYAGEFGHLIEPVIKPLGFDWKMGIALITSLAAREVFVGTMSTIYSVGGNVDDLQTIRAKMSKEVNPETGKPVFSMAAVMSLMVFYAFALQCMSTVSVVRAETKSWKWTGIQFVYLTALAYLSSLLVFQVWG